MSAEGFRAARAKAQSWFTNPDLRKVSALVDARECALSQELYPALALDRFEDVTGTMPRTVLDAGCGSGQMLHRFASYGVPHRYGFDPSLEANRAAYAEPGTHLWLGAAEDARTYALLPAPVDLAVAHLTFSLWPEPVRGVQHLLDALASPGLFVITDLSRSAGALADPVRTEQERAYVDNQVACSYTLPELTELLTEAAPDAGLEIGTGPLGGFMFADDISQRLLQAPRTAAVMRRMASAQISNPRLPQPSLAGCFLTAWIWKGGDHHVSTDS